MAALSRHRPTQMASVLRARMSRSLCSMANTQKHVFAPSLSMTMQRSATLTWHKAPGDFVSEGDMLGTWKVHAGRRGTRMIDEKSQASGFLASQQVISRGVQPGQWLATLVGTADAVPRPKLLSKTPLKAPKGFKW